MTSVVIRMSHDEQTWDRRDNNNDKTNSRHRRRRAFKSHGDKNWKDILKKQCLSRIRRDRQQILDDLRSKHTTTTTLDNNNNNNDNNSDMSYNSNNNDNVINLNTKLLDIIKGEIAHVSQPREQININNDEEKHVTQQQQHRVELQFNDDEDMYDCSHDNDDNFEDLTREEYLELVHELEAELLREEEELEVEYQLQQQQSTPSQYEYTDTLACPQCLNTHTLTFVTDHGVTCSGGCGFVLNIPGMKCDRVLEGLQDVRYVHSLDCQGSLHYTTNNENNLILNCVDCQFWYNVTG